jgi:O-methyltransferase involved in polyketide biosynthesis
MVDAAPPPASGPSGNRRVRFPLTGEQETLVIPLYAKALDYRSPHPILNDATADEIVRQIDYDFEKHPSPAVRLLAVRARQYDEWAREFLSQHPEAVMLNLGCGLDARVLRIRPPPSVRWIDLDFPEVIQFRRNFFSDHAGYEMRSASLTQSEWLRDVPKDRPVMAIAEGVLVYLPWNDAKSLLHRLTDAFAHGQLVFDVMGKSTVRTANLRMGSPSGDLLKWGVDDLREVDAMDSRLRRIQTVPLLGSRYAPAKYRWVYALASLSPRVRRIMRLLRYEF